MRITCGQVRDLARRWADSGEAEISDTVIGSLRVHIAGCDSCRTRYGALPAFLSRGNLNVRGLARSSLAETVMGSLKDERAGTESPPRFLARGWKAAIAAAAVIAVFWAGFVTGGSWTRGGARDGIANGTMSEYVEVRFALDAPSAKTVELIGFFPETADRERTPLSRNVEGTWTVSLRLRKDGVYTYGFLVDGRDFIPDPMSDEFVEDGFGGRDSLLRL